MNSKKIYIFSLISKYTVTNLTHYGVEVAKSENREQLIKLWGNLLTKNYKKLSLKIKQNVFCRWCPVKQKDVSQ